MPEFRRFLSAFAVGAVLVLAGATAMAGDPSAQEMLEHADRFRLPSLDNHLKVSLVSRKSGETADTASYEVWTKGTDRSRVEMLDPRVRGQRVLMTDDGMWLFIPTTRRAIRITPMQRLMGEASYGDIGRMVWRDDYAAEFAQDAAPSAGQVTLRLTARKSAAVYPRIDLRVETESGRPINAEFYLASGKLFKTARFDVPRPVDGEMIVTSIRFVDALSPDQETRMELDEITPSDLPESAFTQAGLLRR